MLVVVLAVVVVLVVAVAGAAAASMSTIENQSFLNIGFGFILFSYIC